jgi:hypothetical protein
MPGWKAACVTGYAPIQTPEAWNNGNVLLGTAVHAVIKHLQLQSPEIIQFVDRGVDSFAIQTKQQPNNNGNARTNHSATSNTTTSRHDPMIRLSFQILLAGVLCYRLRGCRLLFAASYNRLRESQQTYCR